MFLKGVGLALSKGSVSLRLCYRAKITDASRAGRGSNGGRHCPGSSSPDGFGCHSELNVYSPKERSNRTCKCDFIWQEGLCSCNYVKDLEMRSS